MREIRQAIALGNLPHLSSELQASLNESKSWQSGSEAQFGAAIRKLQFGSDECQVL